MIKNKYLRILFLPLALLSWIFQFFCYGIMGCIGAIFSIMMLISALVFGDEIDWEFIFICFIGWWAYYPWLWWYRYITTGQYTSLKEFEEF